MTTSNMLIQNIFPWIVAITKWALEFCFVISNLIWLFLFINYSNFDFTKVSIFKTFRMIMFCMSLQIVFEWKGRFTMRVFKTSSISTRWRPKTKKILMVDGCNLWACGLGICFSLYLVSNFPHFVEKYLINC